MSNRLQFVSPTALEYFGALVADDSSFPLLEAATAVAQDVMPELDVQGELAKVDALALRLKGRLPADAVPIQRLRHLNGFFFQELGFAGNVNNYYDPQNSMMPAVLETRRGIPISLAILYIELASQVGLPAAGVSFPGHFLIKVTLPRGEVVIDPFTGESLSRETLEERLLPFRQRQALPPADEVPLGLFLQPAPPRDIVARLLRNLKEIHRSALDWPRLVMVQRRLLVLLPQVWEEHRDHALALAELGHHEEAATAMDTYLQHNPTGPDVTALRRHLARWRGLH